MLIYASLINVKINYLQSPKRIISLFKVKNANTSAYRLGIFLGLSHGFWFRVENRVDDAATPTRFCRWEDLPKAEFVRYQGSNCYGKANEELVENTKCTFDCAEPYNSDLV